MLGLNKVSKLIRNAGESIGLLAKPHRDFQPRRPTVQEDIARFTNERIGTGERREWAQPPTPMEVESIETFIVAHTQRATVLVVTPNSASEHWANQPDDSWPVTIDAGLPGILRFPTLEGWEVHFSKPDDDGIFPATGYLNGEPQEDKRFLIVPIRETGTYLVVHGDLATICEFHMDGSGTEHWVNKPDDAWNIQGYGSVITFPNLPGWQIALGAPGPDGVMIGQGYQDGHPREGATFIVAKIMRQ